MRMMSLTKQQLQFQVFASDDNTGICVNDFFVRLYCHCLGLICSLYTKRIMGGVVRIKISQTNISIHMYVCIYMNFIDRCDTMP